MSINSESNTLNQIWAKFVNKTHKLFSHGASNLAKSEKIGFEQQKTSKFLRDVATEKYRLLGHGEPLRISV